ncbi:MAG: geranylgeranylglycerol-phosphate geranylgeranyltransferase [Candidatus Bathyarchaeia archaeon]
MARTFPLLRLLAFLSLLRPANCVMMGFAVLIGGFIGADSRPPLGVAASGFLVGFLLTAATMAVNDYYDAEIDKINAPHRPIPSGMVSPLEALWTGAVLSGLGVLLSIPAGFPAFLVAVVALALMVYYNTSGKRTGFLGNVVVSLCVALPFIYGGSAVGSIPPLLILFSAMAFSANLGREVVKGIADLMGDRVGGVRTVAVLLGEAAASRVASLFFALSALVSLIPLARGMVSALYIPFVAVSDSGFIWSSLKILKDPSPPNARRVKGMALAWMLMGLLGFIAGSFKI